MIRFTKSLDNWKAQAKEKPDELVKACCILPDDKVLVVNLQSIHLNNYNLDPLSKVSLNSFVDGLAGKDQFGRDTIGVNQFKPLVHQKNAEYVMLSNIADLWKVEDRGIKHFTGPRYSIHYKLGINHLMILLSFKNDKLRYKSLEDESFLVKKSKSYESHVLELAQNMYMVDTFII